MSNFFLLLSLVCIPVMAAQDVLAKTQYELLRDNFDAATDSVELNRIPELGTFLNSNSGGNCLMAINKFEPNTLSRVVIGRFVLQAGGSAYTLISPPLLGRSSPSVSSFLNADKREFRVQDRDGAMHIFGVALSAIGYSIEYKMSGSHLVFLGRYWTGPQYDVAGYCD